MEFIFGIFTLLFFGWSFIILLSIKCAYLGNIQMRSNSVYQVILLNKETFPILTIHHGYSFTFCPWSPLPHVHQESRFILFNNRGENLYFSGF